MVYDFTTVVKAIFKDKQVYSQIPEGEKERMFFPFNRYMARAVPFNADALNLKGLDSLLGLDIWNNYARRTLLVPNWFYPKFKKEKKKSDSFRADDLDEMDLLLLRTYYPTELAQMEAENQRLEKSVEVKKIKKRK